MSTLLNRSSQLLTPSYNYSPAATPSMAEDRQEFQTVETLSKVQKYQLKFLNHRCAVCEDYATGFHYGVISCNGCCSFFRRTIIGRRSFVCARGGFCNLSKDARCACRACRFAKCKAVGMSTSFLSNKLQIDGDSTHPDYKLPLTPPVLGLDGEQMKLLDSLNQREMALLAVRNGFIDSACPNYSLEYLLDPDYFISSSFQLLYQSNEGSVQFWAVVDLYLAVEYAKTFQEFSCLPKSDQKILLHKSTGVIQLLSQSYYSVQRNSESLIFPDGSKPERDDFKQHYREYFCRPVDYCRRLNLKIQELVLIKGLLLYMDDVDLTPLGREIVLGTRENLTTLFTKYTISQYGPFRGPEKMAEILVAIPAFVELTEKKRSYWNCLDIIEKAKFPRLIEDILFSH